MWPVGRGWRYDWPRRPDGALVCCGVENRPRPLL